MTVPYIVSGDHTITMRLDKTHTIAKDHPLYARVVHCLKNGLEDELCQLLKNPFTGFAEVVNGKVMWNGEELHNVIVDRVFEQQQLGLGTEHMLRFLENLMENPSENSRAELYDFLENKSLPITEDGHFLAYKAVRGNFYDIHSGTVLNEVGTVIEMPRKDVDEDRRRQCSYGYHVGAIEYVRGFGNHDSKYLLVKVNPRDAVAVPLDHNAQKIRVCRYEILSELDPETQLDFPVYSSDGGEEVESVLDFRNEEAEWADEEDFSEWDDDDDEYITGLWDDDDFDLSEEKEARKKELQEIWETWTRDQVVLEAVSRGLVLGVNAGRALRKSGCIALLVADQLGEEFGA